MTAQPIDADAAPAAWLRATLAPWRRSAARTSLLVVADVVPAIGFAAGLALAVGALPRGVAEAAPGMALASVSLLLRAALSQRAIIAASRLSAAIRGAIRRQTTAGAMRSPASQAQAVTATVEGVEALDGHVSRFLPARDAAVISPLILIGASAFASPVTTGILIFTLLPFAIGMALTGMAAAAESRRQFQTMERLSGLFLDRVGALPAILSFQAEAAQIAQIARASDDLARRTTRVLRVAFLSSAVLEFFSALSVALVAVYCGFNLLKLLPFPAPEQLDLSRAFFVLALAPEVYQPMRRLAAAYHDRQAAEAAAPSLAAFADSPAAQPAPPPPAAAPEVRFNRVAIAYGDAAPVLSGFDLTLEPGSVTALVGASGAGKSSLLHLFLGLAPLTSGEVRVGELRLSDGLDLSSWIAWAGQSPYVVPGTLEDNIALAWPGASGRMVMEAAARAGFRGDLGRWLDERGGGLSGGERRRLGLARAFLKPSPLLLLDEPTANLDAASERALLPIIAEAAKGRTTLIATHSEAVAALADRVVRL